MWVDGSFLFLARGEGDTQILAPKEFSNCSVLPLIRFEAAARTAYCTNMRSPSRPLSWLGHSLLTAPYTLRDARWPILNRLKRLLLCRPENTQSGGTTLFLITGLPILNRARSTRSASRRANRSGAGSVGACLRMGGFRRAIAFTRCSCSVTFQCRG